MLKKGKLNYKIIGSGEPVFFLHSYLWDNDMWKNQIDEFTEKYKCIFVELWGHGLSGLLEGTREYTLEELAEDIIDLADELNIDKFSFVGLSVGGMGGCHLGVKYSDRLKKLVIMDSYIGEEPKQSQIIYFNMLDTIEKIGYIPNELANQIAPMFFSIKERTNKGFLYTEFRDKLINMKKDNVPTVVALGRGIFDRQSLIEKLSEVEVPTLVMAGTEDMPRPLYESEKMHKLIKNSLLFPIKNAGHISVVENPLDINKAILKFLIG
jgi:pimeloyl-ACP methyl ester carboxylesterase